jgi:hypothetical protein
MWACALVVADVKADVVADAYAHAGVLKSSIANMNRRMPLKNISSAAPMTSHFDQTKKLLQTQATS